MSPKDISYIDFSWMRLIYFVRCKTHQKRESN